MLRLVGCELLKLRRLAFPKAMDILDNVIPYIGGEEEKLEYEPAKIMGTFDGAPARPNRRR